MAENANANAGRIDLALGVNERGFKREMSGLAPRLKGLTQATFGKLGAIAGAAFGAKMLFDFGKSAIKAGSDVAEIQNVVDVTFGAMSQGINEFSKDLMKNFGLTELSAKKYASTMGAMLKSTGIAAEATRDMSMDLTKLTADLASFYNMDNDVMFGKVMSAMSGMPMPLKQLGINMDVASVEAYALSKGMDKAYNSMNQAEKQMLRYNYLMDLTKDQQGDFSRNAHNWAHSLKVLSGQWSQLKATMGQGFINILQPMVNWLNTIIVKLQTAANYFKAFTELVFGNKQAAKETAKDLGYIGGAAGKVADDVEGAGEAAKKAGKEAKGGLAGFDELNTLMENTSGSAEDLIDELGGAGGVDFGEVSGGDIDIDLDLDKFIKKLDDLKNVAKSGLKKIEPIFELAGEAFSTALSYGIKIGQNTWEPIKQGFLNFKENMDGPINDWIDETVFTISKGFNNASFIFEIVGEMWLSSIDKYKDIIEENVENMFTNIAESGMFIVTFFSDIFELITQSLIEFFLEKQETVQGFMDNIYQIFNDVWAGINKIWEDVLAIIMNAWNTWGKGIVKGVMDFVGDIIGWMMYLWNEIVMPLWDKALYWLSKIWDESFKGILEGLFEFVGQVGEIIVFLWNNIFKPLLNFLIKVLAPVFSTTFEYVLDIISTVISSISGVVDNLLEILNGLIKFIVGVFTGDWEKAWEGVSDVFSGIVNGLIEIFKIPLNWIISGINAFIRGLNKIKIPAWVPGIGGLGFDIAEIPHLAKGGIIDQPTLAMVGEAGKEAVVPLENTEFVDTLANAVANSIGSVMAALMNLGSNSNNDEGEKEINLILDGTIFARLFLPYLEQEISRLGNKVIVESGR